jgi:UDP-2,3-diacylglucosamine hydrolase
MLDSAKPAIDTTSNAQPKPVALFVSDLHLQKGLPRTTQAFLAFLREHATQAQQLYLLGDIFEYWAGDDDLVTPYNGQVAQAIRAVSDAGVAVFWMAGNRDFLVGADFAEAIGATLLPDPFIATIAGLPITLTHGDAQCTDDASYMAFRTQVRQPVWQQEFLARPLAQRKAIIESLRMESQTAQRTKAAEIMDVNSEAIAALFDAAGTSVMIHGHTHRPARHDYADRRIRYVLPDWDCDVEPPRGGWIAVLTDGTIKRIELDGRQSQT